MNRWENRKLRKRTQPKYRQLETIVLILSQYFLF